MIPYVRYTDMVVALGTQSGGRAAVEKSVRTNIAAASQWMVDWTNRRFDWRYQTLWHNGRSTINGGDVNGGRLTLLDDLQELSAIQSGMTIPLEDLMFEPQTDSPFKTALCIVNIGLTWVGLVNRPSSSNIAISGFWGYGGRFINEGQTLTTDVNLSVSIMPLSDVADLEKNDMLRVDDELMRIMSIAGLNVTVERAVNGTTAVAHVNGSSVRRFAVNDRVAWCVMELVLWMRAIEASPTTGKTVVGAGDQEQQIAFDALPKNLRDTLTGLRRKPRIRGS